MSMNELNPRAQPAKQGAHVEAHGVSAQGDFRTQRLVFGALVLLQLLTTLAYAAVYFELTRTGAVNFISFLGAVAGSACLYVAAVFVALGRAKGFITFALAAVLLGSSLRAWSLDYPWGWVIAFGAVLAVAGALLVRVMKVEA